VIASISVLPPKSKPRIYEFRNFQSINTVELLNEASGIEWGDFFLLDSLDDKVALFNNKL
jgi:hypothetical protein